MTINYLALRSYDLMCYFFYVIERIGSKLHEVKKLCAWDYDLLSMQTVFNFLKISDLYKERVLQRFLWRGYQRFLWTDLIILKSLFFTWNTTCTSYFYLKLSANAHFQNTRNQHPYILCKRPCGGLAVPTSDHGVSGWNPTGGEILCEPKWHFIAQPFKFSLPSSWYDWNTVEKDVKPQTIIILCIYILKIKWQSFNYFCVMVVYW